MGQTPSLTQTSLNVNGKLKAAEELGFSASLMISVAEVRTQKYI